MSAVNHGEGEQETLPLVAPSVSDHGKWPELTWSDALGDHQVSLTDRLIIGSAETSDLRVVDRGVSRLHAELELSDDGVWVRDLGSKNGTYVDSTFVRHARLTDGGQLRVGSVTLRMTYPGERPPAAAWPTASFGPLLGESRAMRTLFTSLARVAAMEASVLVLGETGTGKELAAHAIHQASPRAGGPFVVVDCGALPDTLLDAELFGHTRGAFTGAHAGRAGAFEAAAGGTIFLDEIGELPLVLQPKLLRVLEARTVRRLGENSQRPIDVRVVAATHRDLLTMVNEGDFREDLYFRLAVVPVRLPSLRDRREDIVPLVRHFLKRYPDAEIDQATLDELTQRRWRGNVRELRAFVDRWVALGRTHALGLLDGAADPPAAPPPGAAPVEGAETYGGTWRDFQEAWAARGEREYLRRLLAQHDGNVAAAAAAAEVNRTHLYRVMRKYKLGS